jgi:hypothetical protein
VNVVYILNKCVEINEIQHPRLFTDTKWNTASPAIKDMLEAYTLFVHRERFLEDLLEAYGQWDPRWSRERFLEDLLEAYGQWDPRWSRERFLEDLLEAYGQWDPRWSRERFLEDLLVIDLVQLCY